MFLTFIIALAAAILICGLLFLYAFPALSDQAQVFTDIIIETLAKTVLNKSAELSLFRRLCILGIVISFAIVLAECFLSYFRDGLTHIHLFHDSADKI